MYCPKCGAQNADNASFCRGCGTNLSLVPQAMTGRLPEASIVYEDDGRHIKRRKRERPPTITKAITSLCMGIGFLLVALSLRHAWEVAGPTWWFWMLIPAFSMIGGGLAEFARLKERPTAMPLAAAPLYTPPPLAQPQRGGALPPRPASDIYTPTSVTDHTTQLLDHER